MTEIPPPLPKTPVPSPWPKLRSSSSAAAAAFVAASAAAEAAAPDVIFGRKDSDGDAAFHDAMPLITVHTEQHRAPDDVVVDDDKGGGAEQEIADASEGNEGAEAAAVENEYAVPLRKPARSQGDAAAQAHSASTEAPRAAMALPSGDVSKRSSPFDRLGAAFSRLLDKDKDGGTKSDKQLQRLSWNPTSNDSLDCGGDQEKSSGERNSLMTRGTNFLRRSFRVKSTADSDSVDESLPPKSPRSPLPALPGDGEFEPKFSLNVSGSRASVFSEELVASLACSSCSRYMQAPIEQCRRGHNVCRHCCARAARNHHRCPAEGCGARLAGLRNRLAEEVAAKLLFPCANAHVGCTRQVPSDELEFHEPRCPFRLYKCLINVATGVPCPWEGRRTELEAHVRDKHYNYYSSQETTKWRWAPNLVVPMRDYQLLSAHGELFWYCAAQDPKQMRLCWFVSLVGPDVQAMRHNFIFRLTSEDGRILEFTCPTLPDYAVPDAVIEGGRCADLSYAQALSMMDDGKILTFSVTITKDDS